MPQETFLGEELNEPTLIRKQLNPLLRRERTPDIQAMPGSGEIPMSGMGTSDFNDSSVGPAPEGPEVDPIFDVNEEKQVSNMFSNINPTAPSSETKERPKTDFSPDNGSPDTNQRPQPKDSVFDSASDILSGAGDFLSINEDAENPNKKMSAAEVMSGVGAGFGALSNVLAANEKADQKEYELKQKRKDLEVSADAGRVKAQQKQLKINERLNNALAQQKAMQAAKGVQTQSGSAEVSREETIEDAQEAKQRVGTNLHLNRLEKQSRINQLGIMEDYAPDIIEKQGYGKALSSLGQWMGGMAMKKYMQTKRFKQQGGGSGGGGSSSGGSGPGPVPLSKKGSYSNGS